MRLFIIALIIGIVQGITEWLPVSSTGHMILLGDFINFDVSDSFRELFLVVVQLGSALAVATEYFSKLNPFSPQKTNVKSKQTIALWLKILYAVAPAAIVGFLFEDKIYNIFFNTKTVAATLLLYGILFIVIERYNRIRGKLGKSEIGNLEAIGIGCFQVLSLVPGTSRSGATIMGAMLLGIERRSATEFSFYVSLPVMLGASLLKLIGIGHMLMRDELIILAIGMCTAYLVSLLSINLLTRFVKNHSFEVFGWYRILLGAILINDLFCVDVVG